MDLKAQTGQITQNYTKTLSIRRLFNNFFLLHDFFFRFSKLQSYSADFFDIQFDASNSMNYASRSGGRMGQIGSLAVLSLYFIKGNSIPTRVVLGILYGYWVNHFYTIGAYAGVLITLPGVYKRTYEYYEKRPTQYNYLAEVAKYMDKDIEQTQPVLSKIFVDEIKQKSYIKNQYYAKNWEKYAQIVESDVTINKPDLKLKYLDCFATRYVYHSFSRWLYRVQLYVGLKTE